MLCNFTEWNTLCKVFLYYHCFVTIVSLSNIQCVIQLDYLSQFRLHQIHPHPHYPMLCHLLLRMIHLLKCFLSLRTLLQPNHIHWKHSKLLLPNTLISKLPSLNWKWNRKLILPPLYLWLKQSNVVKIAEWFWKMALKSSFNRWTKYCECMAGFDVIVP